MSILRPDLAELRSNMQDIRDAEMRILASHAKTRRSNTINSILLFVFIVVSIYGIKQRWDMDEKIEAATTRLENLL